MAPEPITWYAMLTLPLCAYCTRGEAFVAWPRAGTGAGAIGAAKVATKR